MPCKTALLMGLCIAFANAVAGPVTTEISTHGPIAILDGAGIGLVIWVVAGWCIYALMATPSDQPASTTGLFVLSSCLVLVLIPSAIMAWFVCFAISAWAAFKLRENAKIKSIYLIFAALALRVPVTTLTLSTISDEFLTIDAFLVQIALMLAPFDTQQIGNIIIGTDGHKLAVMTGCSSFTNVSMGLLAWFAISQGSCNHISRRAALAGVGVTLAIIGLNVLRLSLMAVDASLYKYIHDGDGKLMFELSLVITTLLITFIGIGESDARSHDVDCSTRAAAR